MLRRSMLLCTHSFVNKMSLVLRTRAQLPLVQVLLRCVQSGASCQQ